MPTPSPAAPRRTGLATLNDTRSAQPPEGMMSVPELRSYAENAQFMSDLQRGIPPLELREIDLSTGTPVCTTSSYPYSSQPARAPLSPQTAPTHVLLFWSCAPPPIVHSAHGQSRSRLETSVSRSSRQRLQRSWPHRQDRRLNQPRAPQHHCPSVGRVAR